MADPIPHLGKEFKRAGKKRLVLASLFALGLCIWIPMLWRSLFSKTDSPKRASAGSAALQTANQVTQPSADEPVLNADSAQLDWKRVYRRVERSDLVQALALDELVRDPFEKEWIREKKKPAASKTDAEFAAESDPSRFLVLSATLAGLGGGAAVIGDRVYRLGQEVPDQGPVRYVLKEIRPDRVVLERAGNLFDLRLKDVDQAAKESSELVK